MKHNGFEERLDRYESELGELFASLYPSGAQACGEFVRMLQEMWKERPQDMKRLDLKRLKSPDW